MRPVQLKARYLVVIMRFYSLRVRELLQAILYLSIILVDFAMQMQQRPWRRVQITDFQLFQDIKVKQPLHSIVVAGDTSLIPADHDVLRVLSERWRSGSKPGQRAASDQAKVALCIEGGGMRGCVAAGATASINFLGLNDAVDAVYGSSAGAMVSAYFISRQLSGVQIYYGMISIYS